LEADPYEMTNLAPDPAYTDVLPEMATRMWRRIHEIEPAIPARCHCAHTPAVLLFVFAIE